MEPAGWTCLGGPHLADLAEIEQTLARGDTVIAIQRCRTCGQLYRHERFEVNDWSGSGDYSDETCTWTTLSEDEVYLVRTDPNYEPRSGLAHRSDTGWRRS